MKTTNYFLLGTGIVLGGAALFVSQSYPSFAAEQIQTQQTQQKGMMMQHKGNVQAEVLSSALAARSYTAFVSATSGSHLGTIITTEAKFMRFLEMHDLMTKARAIAEELGLPGKGSFGERQGKKGGKMGRGMPMGDIENVDYATFVKQIEGTPMEAVINTEDKFEQFKEMHTLMQEGNVEAAEAMRTELGLPEKGQLGMERGRKGQRK